VSGGLAFPFPPMEAQLVGDIPTGDGWQYEPKWDGFRCLVFRDQADVRLQSKSGQPLERYFPEVVAIISALRATRFVLDGELVVPAGRRLSFDSILQRIHPAESRIRKLSQETPAHLVVFDLLQDGRATLTDLPLAGRRARLEAFVERFAADHEGIHLSPATTSLAQARRWLRSGGGGLDGVVAKRLDLPYRSGDRTGMQKVKLKKTADCVAGGFRYASAGRVVGSLLLGLFDEEGLLHHVGFTSGFKARAREEITAKIEPLKGGEGFTGQRPGGPSRWSTKRSTEWEPLRTELVVEVEYDHFDEGRFRHGTSFRRWRPDKAPAQCTFDQLAESGSASMRLLRKRSG
jgi:ATP-dependent DNA ligase